MERFMEMSTSFMDSVDLQNGVFEEEGLKMLEKFENILSNFCDTISSKSLLGFCANILSVICFAMLLKIFLSEKIPFL